MTTQITIAQATELIKNLCSNHFDKGCQEEAIGTLQDVGYFSMPDNRGNVRWINDLTETSVKRHLNRVVQRYY